MPGRAAGRGDLGIDPDFLLDPSITFLNHGSFGACPRPVFEAYQQWQRELEHQPVEFLGRRAEGLLAQARASLAGYLHVATDEVVYFANPTGALNMVARSLMSRATGRRALRPGDEILATDHEYGALERTWRFVCRQTGAVYVPRSLPLPLTSPEAFIEGFWAAVSARTRVIFLSHITSPTALIFPVSELCRRARAAGILTVVDGAHAPGQIPLDLAEIGADVYAGACHKWLCAPKGAAFVYARREVQDLLEPLVVSWGWETERPSASRFIDHHEWQGTRDFAAFLSVPSAIAYQAAHDWPAVRARCHALACEAHAQINALTGLEPLSRPGAVPPAAANRLAHAWFAQMFAARLPLGIGVEATKARLYDDYRIEVPVYRWHDQPLIRVSVQTYNNAEDLQALLAALRDILDL